MMQAKRLGITPWSVDTIRPDDKDVVRSGLHRDVKEVAALILFEADGPHRADVAVEGGLARLPVHQIAAVPDGKPRVSVEAGKGQVIVIAILEDRGVRSVA